FLFYPLLLGYFPAIQSDTRIRKWLLVQSSGSMTLKVSASSLRTTTVTTCSLTSPRFKQTASSLCRTVRRSPSTSLRARKASRLPTSSSSTKFDESARLLADQYFL